MARLRGLVLRGGVFYSRVVVPKPLQTEFGCREKLKSLKTANRKEAEALHLQNVAEWKAAFVEASQRGIKPPRPYRITDAEAATLARRFFLRAKEDVERTGASPAELDTYQREAVSEDLQTQVFTLNSWRHPDTNIWVEKEIKTLFESEGTPLAAEQASQTLSEYIRRALIEICNIQLSRLHGDFSDEIRDSLFRPTGSAQSTFNPHPHNQAASLQVTLGECIDRYISEELSHRSVTPKTAHKYASLLAHIGLYFGRDTPIAEITRAECNKFRNTISQLPPKFVKFAQKNVPLDRISQSNKSGRTLAWDTQRSYLKMLSDVLEWAKRDRLVQDNAAEGLIPQKRREPAETARLPFKAEELNAIFSAPLFTGCVNDENGFAKPGPNIIKRSRYWVPLLALFTGMRMGEILQLTPHHIRKSASGTNFIALTRSMTLKTDNAVREIPIHPELERLGFIDWVDGKRGTETVPLFVEVPMSKFGNRTDIFSKRFAIFLRKVDLPVNRKAKLCFHSFRHTFKDGLNATGATEEIKDEICGWARTKNVGRRYGSGLSADQLKPHMDQVSFEIDLRHL